MSQPPIEDYTLLSDRQTAALVAHGRVEVEAELVIGFDHGRTVPWVRRRHDFSWQLQVRNDLACLRRNTTQPRGGFWVTATGVQSSRPRPGLPDADLNGSSGALCRLLRFNWAAWRSQSPDFPSRSTHREDTARVSRIWCRAPSTGVLKRIGGTEMMHWGNHMNVWGSMFIGLSFLLFWAAVITAIVLLVRALRSRQGGIGQAPTNPAQEGLTSNQQPGHEASPGPEQILANRFATGEIDADEYQSRLEVLRQHQIRT